MEVSSTVLMFGVATMLYYSTRLYLSDADLGLTQASVSKIPAAFANKSVWVTGGSSGIGKEVALRLAKLGATVLVSARSLEGLKQVKDEIEQSGGKAEILQLDLAQLDTLKEKVKEASRILGRPVDILVNNGGLSQRSLCLTTCEDVEHMLMTVNFTSATILAKALCEEWVQRPEKATDPKGIINISSLAGKVGSPLRTSYSASKFALLGYMDVLRFEMLIDNANITISNICPGSVLTNVSKNALTGTGEKYGATDENIASGMSVQRCVSLILRAYANKLPEVWMFGSFKEKLGVYFAIYFPTIYFAAIQRNRNAFREMTQRILNPRKDD